MRDTNTVVIIGRLTKDPEYKKVGENTVASMSIASNQGKDKSGNERTDFFDISYWGKGAEAVKPYLAKGKQVLIQGRLEQQKWEKDGKNYSKIQIRVDTLQLIGSKADENKTAETKPSVPSDEEFLKDSRTNDTEDVPF